MTIYSMKKPFLAFAFCALIGTGGFVPGAQATITSVPVEDEIIEDYDEAEMDADDVEIDREDALENGASADQAMPPMPPIAAEDIPAAPTAVLPQRATQLETVAPEQIKPRGAVLPAMRGGQDNSHYVEPVGSTHPALYLTPDKSAIVRLDRPAASVVVGNEAHINVLIDTPQTLILVPRQPGASYFSVLDAQSRIVMQRHVIVGPADQYVRVRRSCGADKDCESTSVFYCPDGMCHPVTTMQEPGAAPAQDEAFSAGGARIQTGPDFNEEPVAE